MKINRKQLIKELEQRINIYKNLYDLSIGLNVPLNPSGYIDDYDILIELRGVLIELIEQTKEHIKLIRIDINQGDF